MTHPIEALFGALAEVAPYPAGVVPLPARIPGTAFFPGGAGLWAVQAGAPLPPMPLRGVMIVGHDFHSEVAFARSYAEGTEVPGSPSGSGYRVAPTWRSLLALLSEVGIAPEQCFFTNAYMGLRQGAGTTGRFPGSLDEPFVERCRRFFQRQVAAQRPRLVITLGVWVPPFVAPLAPELASWRAVRTIADLDALGPVQHEVLFGRLGDRCSVVALTHPSLRGSNVGHRRYGNVVGHAAETAMLRESLARAGLDRAAH